MKNKKWTYVEMVFRVHILICISLCSYLCLHKACSFREMMTQTQSQCALLLFRLHRSKIAANSKDTIRGCIHIILISKPIVMPHVVEIIWILYLEYDNTIQGEYDFIELINIVWKWSYWCDWKGVSISIFDSTNFKLMHSSLNVKISFT